MKTVSELFLPVGGTILELNAELDATPELINTDPYGKGWIVKMSVSELSEVESLLSAEAYAALIG